MVLKLNSTTTRHSLMYQAIEEDKLEDLKLLLENGMDVNEPIITTGEFSGFTALHVACMKNNNQLVELLVDDFKADINAIAADGTQPIHLACFYTQVGYTPEEKLSIEKLKTLVKANANVDAEFGEDIFLKHVKDREWCPDFGDKMPLVAYSVIYNKPTIINNLKNVNVDIISLKNQTLLMYAVEHNCYKYISTIMSHVEDPKLMDKLINHRDNDDVPVTHYPLLRKKYRKLQHQQVSSIDDFHGQSFFSEVLKWGADMYALINNDPVTLLPNLAAYKNCAILLKDLLPYYTSMSSSRVLYYATLPVFEEFGYSIHSASIESIQFASGQLLLGSQRRCIVIALKDLVFRGVFKLPVDEEEVKLMDKLIASDENLKNIVDDYKTNFIEKELRERFIIKVGDNKMTMYDFVMQVFDDKKLKFLAREEYLLNYALPVVFVMSFDSHGFFETYYEPIMTRIKDAEERLRLFENLKEISSLRKAIPLPFELVLDIVEYLNNRHFKLFINAFYGS